MGTWHYRYRKGVKTEKVPTKGFFPRLVEPDNPMVPEEEKAQLRVLLEKPWNLYVRRHTGLTERGPKMGIFVLCDFAGWSPGSKMAWKYVHPRGGESTDFILEQAGLAEQSADRGADKLKPIPCKCCGELNTPEALQCIKCRIVLNEAGFEGAKASKVEEDKRMAEIAQNQILATLVALQKSGQIDQNAINSLTKPIVEGGLSMGNIKETTIQKSPTE